MLNYGYKFGFTKQSGGGGASSPYLDGVLSGVVFELDATIADSYPGTGTTWANLTASPADGSAQTAYDFYLGNDGVTATQFPTFNGSAGDAAAYWSFDGGDFFTLKSGANTDFLNNLHKTTGGQDFTIVFTAQHSDNTWGNSRSFFITQFAWNGTQHGIWTETRATEDYRLGQSGGSIATADSPGVQTSGEFITMIAHNHSANETTFWVRSATGGAVAHTFTTSTAAASIAAQIGRLLTAEERLYSMAMLNKVITDEEAALIIAHMEARHSRDYTP